MFVIIVIGVVLVSVLGGFFLEGGIFLVLMQWSEFIIILGSATGALVVATPKTTLVKMVQYVLGSFKSTGVSKESFQELLLLLYETFQIARVKVLLTLEQHVEKPEESELFSKYPVILKSHHTLEYLVDSLKLMVVGGVPPLELEALLDSDLETQEEEGKKPAHALARTADSLPGLGIVAAVLGIVLTMQAHRRPGLGGGTQGGRSPSGHLSGSAHVLRLRVALELPNRVPGRPGGALSALHQSRRGGLCQGHAPHRGGGVRPPGHRQ